MSHPLSGHAAPDIADYDEAYGPPLWPEDPVEGPRTFEIGLVLAGAVSAGAYIGGVLDFLFEALDAYEDERSRAIAAGEPGAAARHKVLLRVISGASAGGMSAAMVATAARRRFAPIRCPADADGQGGRNPFYAPWVRQVDMRWLLGESDLAGARAPVRSLLDCSVLDKMRDEILSFPQRADATDAPIDRPWLPDRLKLCFTVTNLRGVPYSFAFDGSPGASYTMTCHADIARFSVKLRGQADARPDEVDLAGESSAADPGWTLLGNAALATGSFPLALRSRTITPLPALYSASFFPDHAQISPATGNPAPPVVAYRIDGEVKHLADGRCKFAPYSYASADGGMIDNEPLEWARIELAGILGRNPRGAVAACRALIMVDPFPDPPLAKDRLAADGRDAHADAEQETLLSLAGGMITAMKNQGRFHPEDIRLALDSSVASRFIISPSGRDKDKQDPEKGSLTGGAALASGALGGFSGFLCEAYRHHDFMLGRENCRSFLQKYFRIPVTTSDASGNPVRSWLFAEEPDVLPDDDPLRGRAIIPLHGTAAVTPAPRWPDWPVDACDAAALRQPIGRRIRLVAGRSIEAMEPGGFKAVLDFGWRAFGGLASGAMAKKAVAQINRALQDHGLRT